MAWSKPENIDMEDIRNISRCPKRSNYGGLVRLVDPLELDEILEHVFNFLIWKELNVARLVCKDWHRVSLPIWRNKAPTKCLCGTSGDPMSPRSMSRFLTEVYGSGRGGGAASARADPELFPGLRQYKHFQVVWFYPTSTWDLLNIFLREAGRWITKLHLCQIDFHRLIDFRRVVSCSLTPSVEYLTLSSNDLQFEIGKEENDGFDLSAATSSSEFQKSSGNPCVKSLDMELFRPSGDYSDDDLPRLPVSWTEFLQWYPRLQHLRLTEGGNGFWREKADKAFNAITKLRRLNQNHLRLKSLDLVDLEDFENAPAGDSPPPTLPLHNLFANNEFHLEALGLDVTRHVPLAVFHGLLTQQSTSLKRLVMRTAVPLQNFQLPEMSCLESFILFGQAFPDLTFLKKCPKLKSMALKWSPDAEFNIIRDTNTEDMRGVVLTRMREFGCKQGDNYNEEDFKRLNVWMPNLKSLHVDILPAESFRMVCKLWPPLEELTCFGNELDDEVITGIPKGCKTLPESRLCSNLTDLKELRRLQLPVLWQRRAKLTDKSVLFGFLQLSKLTSLLFSADTLSTRMLDLLMAKIPDVEVIYNNRDIDEILPVS